MKNIIRSIYKKWEFDYNTYKYIYTWELEKTFGVNYIINNKKIDWYIEAFIDWKIVFEIISKWEFDKKYFKLDNKFELKNILLESFVKWFNSSASEDEKISIEKLVQNINFEFDKRYNQNNANIYADLNFDNDKIAEFNFEVKANRDYKDVKINIPSESNVINFEEIMY